MLSKDLFPSLSEDGWVESPSKKLDSLLSHFFVSDFSQTYIYPGQVASLPYIIATNKGSIPDTVNELQNKLTMYLSRYFSKVTVEVSSEDLVEGGSGVGLRTFIAVTGPDNKEIIAGKLLKIENTKLQEVIDINNG